MNFIAWAELQSHSSSLGVIIDPVSHFAPEAFLVIPKVLRGLDVQRILKVCEVREETVEAPDDIFDPPGGRPAEAVEAVRSEEREADVAVHWDVGVPQLG